MTVVKRCVLWKQATGSNDNQQQTNNVRNLNRSSAAAAKVMEGSGKRWD